MKFIRRRQYFVDKSVQGRLVTRTISQWFCCLASIAIMLFCWRIATHPAETFSSHFFAVWSQAMPAFAGAVFLLPLVVMDVIKMSNRFVGPTVRLRNAMKRYAAGEEVRPVRFRDADLWHDMADDFNAMLARFNREQPHGEDWIEADRLRAAGADEPVEEQEQAAEIDLMESSQATDEAAADALTMAQLLAAEAARVTTSSQESSPQQTAPVGE